MQMPVTIHSGVSPYICMFGMMTYPSSNFRLEGALTDVLARN